VSRARRRWVERQDVAGFRVSSEAGGHAVAGEESGAAGVESDGDEPHRQADAEAHRDGVEQQVARLGDGQDGERHDHRPAELLGLLAEPAPLALSPGHTTPPWRHIAWWDGKRPERVHLGDEWLQDAGVVRLVGTTPSPAPVVLVAKAGHNAENHNHNDVGTFILHIDGETFLTDPGRGLYSRSYFSPTRYENLFCSSFGHSLPVIGGQLQAAGAAYRGEIVACDLAGPTKRLVMSIGGAYPVPELRSLTRTLTLGPDGQFDCEDRPDLQSPLEVEEAFVTWLEVTVSGAIAKLTGQRHVVELSIAEPAGARFHLEVLEEASRANAKPALLKRLSFRVPAGSPSARVQARLIA